MRRLYWRVRNWWSGVPDGGRVIFKHQLLGMIVRITHDNRRMAAESTYGCRVETARDHRLGLDAERKLMLREWIWAAQRPWTTNCGKRVQHFEATRVEVNPINADHFLVNFADGYWDEAEED